MLFFYACIIVRAYLSEGNHRIVCLENLEVHWLPIKVNYFFINDDQNPDFPFIPAVLKEFPKHLTASMCGFEVKEL